jgi:DNA-directed RNA polymerase subunit M/transcription elongation factor TFIIS
MTDDGVDAPVGSVRCTCGASVPVAATDVGQEQVCSKCKSSFKVVWAIDPKSKEKVLTRLAAKGGAIRIPAGSLELVCSCGQVLVARKDQAGKRVKCPVCGSPMVIEKYKDPLTDETRVRRSSDPGSKSRETAIIAAKPLGRTTRRRRAPEGAQDILCQCGENLRVFSEQLDKKVLCPECGTLMKMEKNSSGTQVRPRIVGKADVPPKADPDEWSLSDFS